MDYIVNIKPYFYRLNEGSKVWARLSFNRMKAKEARGLWTFANSNVVLPFFGRDVEAWPPTFKCLTTELTLIDSDVQ